MIYTNEDSILEAPLGVLDLGVAIQALNFKTPRKVFKLISIEKGIKFYTFIFLENTPENLNIEIIPLNFLNDIIIENFGERAWKNLQEIDLPKEAYQAKFDKKNKFLN